MRSPAMNKGIAARTGRDSWTIERCEKETKHAQKKNSHFCHCTHVMYDSARSGAVPMHAAQSMTEDERRRRRQVEAAAEGQHRAMRNITDFADKWELKNGSASTKPYQFAIDFARELVGRASSEIHILEVQRDQAQMIAKGIVLDLIAERSAEELKCWLCGPVEFKQAVIARLNAICEQTVSG